MLNNRSPGKLCINYANLVLDNIANAWLFSYLIAQSNAAEETPSDVVKETQPEGDKEIQPKAVKEIQPKVVKETEVEIVKESKPEVVDSDKALGAETEIDIPACTKAEVQSEQVSQAPTTNEFLTDDDSLRKLHFMIYNTFLDSFLPHHPLDISKYISCVLN